MISRSDTCCRLMIRTLPLLLSSRVVKETENTSQLGFTKCTLSGQMLGQSLDWPFIGDKDKVTHEDTDDHSSDIPVTSHHISPQSVSLGGSTRQLRSWR